MEWQADTLNGERIIVEVNARDLESQDRLDNKFIATRYAEVMAFEKGNNATGVWYLPGSAINHQRFYQTQKDNPGQPHTQLVA